MDSNLTEECNEVKNLILDSIIQIAELKSGSDEEICDHSDEVKHNSMDSEIGTTIQVEQTNSYLNHMISEVNENDDAKSEGENSVFDTTTEIYHEDLSIDHIQVLNDSSFTKEIIHNKSAELHELENYCEPVVTGESALFQRPPFPVPVHMVNEVGTSPVVVLGNQHFIKMNSQVHTSMPSGLSSIFIQSEASTNDPRIPQRKKVVLRLLEELDTVTSEEKPRGLFSRVSSFRPRSKSVGTNQDIANIDLDMSSSTTQTPTTIDRGEIVVSWYDGTTAVELQEQVRRSVENKLRLGPNALLLNLRVLVDNGENGLHEEIVLSPYVPDESKFILSFRVKDLSKKWNHRAPPSPSAAPSPPSEMEQLLHEQLSEVAHLKGTTLSSSLQVPIIQHDKRSNKTVPSMKTHKQDGSLGLTTESPVVHDLLSQKLEKLNDTLLMLHGTWDKDQADVQSEQKQVVFMIANYFVLFLSVVAISAEIHERAPRWVSWFHGNMSTVQNCARDKDTLFQCVSEGNFSGLVASIALWASQSVATKRLFLFGFDSTHKLWTAVYEAGVSAICWGFSYIFIRRGLNPDTRKDCLRKYWKDAVYGSLAGFNSAFLKAVLKNLMPQDQVLDVLETRQIHVVSFIRKLFKHH